MIKVKHRRTVDCVIGGYRLHKDPHPGGLHPPGPLRPARRTALHRPLLVVRGARGPRSPGRGSRPCGRRAWWSPRPALASMPAARGASAVGAATKTWTTKQVLPDPGGRGQLRPVDRRPLPPRHPLRALAAGQRPPRMHHAATRAAGGSRRHRDAPHGRGRSILGQTAPSLGRAPSGATEERGLDGSEGRTGTQLPLGDPGRLRAHRLRVPRSLPLQLHLHPAVDAGRARVSRTRRRADWPPPTWPATWPWPSPGERWPHGSGLAGS